MQTFLPYQDFRESARCLDNRRLNKQIQETRQILRHLTGELPFKGGFRNHPAVLQWKGYEEALKLYQNCCIDEWLSRKKKDGSQITSNRDKYKNVNYDKLVFPWWLGDERLHSSHRGRLRGKMPDWYNQFGWTDPIHPYWWPVEVNNASK